jgi:threonine/homoserine/homoserine lactone efflux protein
VPLALTAFTVARAGYLLYLGIRTLRSAGAVNSTASLTAGSSSGRFFTRGIGVNALNPRGVLIFVSILPQLTQSTNGWSLLAQLAVLGSVHIVLTALLAAPNPKAMARLP